jgi:hypothetical protein
VLDDERGRAEDAPLHRLAGGVDELLLDLGLLGPFEHRLGIETLRLQNVGQLRGVADVAIVNPQRLEQGVAQRCDAITGEQRKSQRRHRAHGKTRAELEGDVPVLGPQVELARVVVALGLGHCEGRHVGRAHLLEDGAEEHRSPDDMAAGALHHALQLGRSQVGPRAREVVAEFDVHTGTLAQWGKGQQVKVFPLRSSGPVIGDVPPVGVPRFRVPAWEKRSRAFAASWLFIGWRPRFELMSREAEFLWNPLPPAAPEVVS